VSINELTQGRHRVVYAVGPRVLLLRLSLINVDVTTPDICRRGVVNPSTGNSEEVGGLSSRPWVRRPRKDQAAVSTD